MARMLELLDLEFKTTMINILRILMNKVDSMQKDWQSKQRNGNAKKEPKRNASNKNTNRNKECLQ